MKDSNLFKFAITIIFLLSSINVYSSDIKIIKNPKPNMVESNYVQLKKIKTVSADLGRDEFLFNPVSITIDSNCNLFVYDRMQAKIFKFNGNLELLKSFGRKGQGPGEFNGAYPVFINIGRDGKLYANDISVKKIIVFNPMGEYVSEYKYKGVGVLKPIVDFDENCYFLSVADNRNVDIFSQKDLKLFTLDNVEESFNYLFAKPGVFYMEMESKIQTGGLLVDLTSDSKLLIYFPSSSIMYVLKERKIVKKMNIWPKEAFTSYKNEIIDLIKGNKNYYKSLFFELFVDEDDNNMFYLQFGENKQRGINALYKLSLNGELIKILYVESPSFARFKLKKKNRFYALEDENILIYKEGKE
jgi:hypothetical protein